MGCLAFAFPVSDGCVKDVTKRYASDWMSQTRRLRVDATWWRDALDPFRPLDAKRDEQEELKLQGEFGCVLLTDCRIDLASPMKDRGVTVVPQAQLCLIYFCMITDGPLLIGSFRYFQPCCCKNHCQL